MADSGKGIEKRDQGNIKYIHSVAKVGLHSYSYGK